MVHLRLIILNYLSSVITEPRRWHQAFHCQLIRWNSSFSTNRQFLHRSLAFGSRGRSLCTGKSDSLTAIRVLSFSNALPKTGSLLNSQTFVVKAPARVVIGLRKFADTLMAIVGSGRVRLFCTVSSVAIFHACNARANALPGSSSSCKGNRRTAEFTSPNKADGRPQCRAIRLAVSESVASRIHLGVRLQQFTGRRHG